MPLLRPPTRALGHLKPSIRRHRAAKRHIRTLSTAPVPTSQLQPHVEGIPLSMRALYGKKTHKRIKAIPSPPSAHNICPTPLATITASQLSVLDPTGARTRLFAKTNPDAAKVGDVLLVRFRSGDPFAGVCLNIRRRGVDTAVLLRGNLTRVGVEMWVKVYSPNVEGVEVVQRRERRARRARLYYLRQPKHDIGSVENLVRQYNRRKAILGTADAKTASATAGKKKSKKNRKL
ncbi:hypothetical protein M501DRAFT_1055447 [Patellaria atrata CBS 101060]|uniref:Mitochondrial ribosomal protein n=1 Tax=Patellaria atrata CBS 101060 TaxID=1346257 RepID=A0A9P4SFE4_9PEZI|nr:hypothetical protein M501DRAFT_1055447 [Patellaria atrata CBS 101060]